MKADIYSQLNSKVGTVDLPDRIFGVRWNPALVHQMLTASLANLRRPWAHAKGRGEVRGGGKKPWRQKGTGRARHGSTRSPIWRKGGKAHGPTKERDYSQKINKKMKQQALYSALSKKFHDGDLKIFDTWELQEPKTKTIAGITKGILKAKPSIKKYDVLFITPSENKNLFRAARNLGKAKVLYPQNLNLYDILNYKHLFLDQRAIADIGAQQKKEKAS